MAVNDKLKIDTSTFGNRPDGTPKSKEGWLGVLPMQDGSGRVATEMSATFNIDGEDILFPLLNPTLSKEEINYLLKGNKPTKEIFDKAYQFGVDRMKQGLSPFTD